MSTCIFQWQWFHLWISHIFLVMRQLVCIYSLMCTVSNHSDTKWYIIQWDQSNIYLLWSRAEFTPYLYCLVIINWASRIILSMFLHRYIYGNSPSSILVKHTMWRFCFFSHWWQVFNIKLLLLLSPILYNG